MTLRSSFVAAYADACAQAVAEKGHSELSLAVPGTSTGRSLLYTLCERKKRATEALSYNALVQSFPEILRIAAAGPKPAQAQQTSFLNSDDN